MLAMASIREVVVKKTKGVSRKKKPRKRKGESLLCKLRGTAYAHVLRRGRRSIGIAYTYSFSFPGLS